MQITPVRRPRKQLTAVCHELATCQRRRKNAATPDEYEVRGLTGLINYYRANHDAMAWMLKNQRETFRRTSQENAVIRAAAVLVEEHLDWLNDQREIDDVAKLGTTLNVLRELGDRPGNTRPGRDREPWTTAAPTLAGRPSTP